MNARIGLERGAECKPAECLVSEAMMPRALSALLPAAGKLRDFTELDPETAETLSL